MTYFLVLTLIICQCVIESKSKMISSKTTDSSALETEKLEQANYTDLNGRKLIVSCHTTSVSAVIRQDSDHTWYLHNGIFKYGLDTLMQKYNFTIAIITSTGGGTLNHTTGKWSGTVRSIMEGKADMGLGLAWNIQRSSVIEFASPLLYDWMTFTTGIAQPYFTWKSMFLPLSLIVWVQTICVSLFIYSIICYLTRYQGYPTRLYFVIYLMATLLEQHQKAKWMLGRGKFRIIVSMWLLFCLLIATSYRSKLLFFLRYPVLQEPLRGFKEISESSATEYNLTLREKGGSEFLLFATTSSSMLKSISKRLYKEPSRLQCMIRGIGNTKEVCIIYDSHVDYVLMRDFDHGRNIGIQPLRKSPDTLNFVAITIGFPKGSSIATMFDGTIQRVKSMGLDLKWKYMSNQVFRNERGEMADTTAVDIKINKIRKATTTKRLRREHFNGLYYIYGLGILLSIFTAVMEMFIKHAVARLIIITFVKTKHSI